MTQKMTIEDLAIIIQKTMASKEDIVELRQEIKSVKESVQLVLTEVDGLRDDIKQEKAANRVDYASVDTRLTRLEQA